MKSLSLIAIAVLTVVFTLPITAGMQSPPGTAAEAVSTATPVANSVSTPASQVIDGIPGLRLRSGPSLSHAVLRTLLPGARLNVTGRSADATWLAVDYRGLSGWVAARYVQHPPANLPVVPSVAATTSTPTPLPAISTPVASVPPSASAAPAALVMLGPDTAWPVRAERITGWGYEFVDASTQWDLILHRDVFGTVAHSFWGPALYERHPHGIRITLIDPVWDQRCPSPLAPIPLMAGEPCLLEGFGDGTGAQIYVGCAVASQHYTDPVECFITIVSGGEHLSDIVAAATVTGYNLLVAGYPGRTPDFAKAPFTPLLGDAFREGDQWRWRNLFLEVTPGT